MVVDLGSLVTLTALTTLVTLTTLTTLMPVALVLVPFAAGPHATKRT